eukprot:4758676-Amphidinium_carterae.1
MSPVSVRGDADLLLMSIQGAIEIHEDDGSSKKHEVKHQVAHALPKQVLFCHCCPNVIILVLRQVWSQVLTGAEAENARRDELLKKRQKLLGGDAA